LRLVYAALCSLDGAVNDERGEWEFAFPDEDVHAAVNELERPIGTHLYGRRTYEVLSAWETMDDPEPLMQDYAAMWRSSDKVVYSTRLDAVTTSRTRLERAFDAAAVRAMKASATTDVSISGPTLAAHAFAAGLVDDVHLFVAPAIVGSGTRALPDGVRLDLALVSERRFASGFVHLQYRVR
jgi:dihydrofolate reductase